MNRNPNANDAIIEKVVGNRQVEPSYYIITKHAENEECVKVELAISIIHEKEELLR